MAAIYRSASRVVPLTMRASAAGSQRYMHHQRSALLAAVNRPSNGNISQRSLSSYLERYSSKNKIKPDASLLRAIKTEIQNVEDHESANKGLDHEEKVRKPHDFPFEIEDHPGQQTITLKRFYRGETITVQVHVPELDEDDDDNEDSNSDYSEEDEEEEGNGKQSIRLVVRVSFKTRGPSLEFDCTAYVDDQISIDNLAIKDPAAQTLSEDEIAYEGPDFGDLDENLQKPFYKYLETRGIKPSITNFLHAYMLDKGTREYITWLDNLHKFFDGHK